MDLLTIWLMMGVITVVIYEHYKRKPLFSVMMEAAFYSRLMKKENVETIIYLILLTCGFLILPFILFYVIRSNLVDVRNFLQKVVKKLKEKK